MPDYSIGSKESLLRVQVTDKETGKKSNMFFDDYDSLRRTVDAMVEAGKGRYSFCSYGGYYVQVIGN